MTMSDETRRLLREKARQKRGVKLKDYTPQEILLATDAVKDALGDISPTLPEPCVPLAYFKYATPAQIEGAAQGLPHRCVRLRFRQGRDVGERDIVGFAPAHLMALTQAIHLSPMKYVATTTEYSTQRFLRDVSCYDHITITNADLASLQSEVAKWPGWEDVRFFKLAGRTPYGERWRGWSVPIVVCRRQHFDPFCLPYLTARPVLLTTEHRANAPDLASLSHRLRTCSEWEHLPSVLEDYFAGASS